VSGAVYPTQFKGQSIQPMEGRSLVGAFKAEPISRDALYWEHEGNAAIRVGDRKLVRKGRDSDWELYDLKADRTELHNLATTHPEEVQALDAQWEAWALRAHVKPYPANGKAKGGGKKGKGKKEKAGVN
jgi:arylsulfatase